MAKYYVKEHELGYQKIKAEGKTTWDELHEPASFGNFSMRPILERTLPLLNFSAPRPRTLEYGCGTGPGACFLAARGFQAEGIDISPIAIDLAKQFAAERRLDINYTVADICDLPLTGHYDLIVDSFCLQCIVTDADREKVLAAVRSGLEPQGYYLIGTAIFTETRDYGDEVFDAETGTVYTKKDNDESFEDAVKLSGSWYLPNRRHLKPQVLLTELEKAGFNTLWHHEEGSSMGLICQRTQRTISGQVSG